MKKHSRVKGFKFNQDVLESWKNKMKDINDPDQLQEELQNFVSVRNTKKYTIHTILKPSSGL